MKNYIKNLELISKPPLKKKSKGKPEVQSLYQIMDSLNYGKVSNLLKTHGIKDWIKVESNKELRYRGSRSNLTVLNPNKIYKREKSPWWNLPNIKSFELNKEVGQNLFLDLFGLQSKAYAGEPSSKPKELNFIKIKKGLTKGQGSYESKKHIIKELNLLNDEKETEIYWWILTYLQFHSKNWFILNLINWKPDWYKEISISGLIKIIKQYNDCQKNQLKPVKEVWIHDNKKWRNLAIANPGTRLFLSGLNKFLMFYLNDHLTPYEYHGFMYSRGVGTYWKRILKSGLLNSEVILEADLANCFNNVDKEVLYNSMRTKYQINELIIKIIHAHNNVEIQKPAYKDLPSKDGLIERIINKDFNHEKRGLVQGLPTSPILAIIAIKNGLDEVRTELQLSKSFKMLTYADDLSFFMSEKDYKKLGHNWKTTLSESKAFKKNGLKIDEQKSQIVKQGGKIYSDLKLLGLKYRWKDKILQSETRGRNANLITGKKATKAQSLDLNFPRRETDLDVELENFINKNIYLKKIKHLTNQELIKNEHIKYFNTIISYLYKGSERVEQNFSLKNSKKDSILHKLMNNKNPEVYIFLKKWKIDFTTISSYLTESLIRILTRKKCIKTKELLEFCDEKNSKIHKIKFENGGINHYNKEIIKFDNKAAPFWKKAKNLTTLELEMIEKEYKTYFDKFNE
jgi:hypothetical protein